MRARLPTDLGPARLRGVRGEGSRLRRQEAWLCAWLQHLLLRDLESLDILGSSFFIYKIEAVGFK